MLLSLLVMQNYSKKHFHCDFCDGITQTKIIDYTLKRFGREFLLKDIEAEVCPNCDNAYLPGQALKEAEAKIKEEMALEIA